MSVWRLIFRITCAGRWTTEPEDCMHWFMMATIVSVFVFTGWDCQLGALSSSFEIGVAEAWLNWSEVKDHSSVMMKIGLMSPGGELSSRPMGLQSRGAGVHFWVWVWRPATDCG